jgi:hypothetical protein
LKYYICICLEGESHEHFNEKRDVPAEIGIGNLLQVTAELLLNFLDSYAVDTAMLRKGKDKSAGGATAFRKQ